VIIRVFRARPKLGKAEELAALGGRDFDPFCRRSTRPTGPLSRQRRRRHGRWDRNDFGMGESA